MLSAISRQEAIASYYLSRGHVSHSMVCLNKISLQIPNPEKERKKGPNWQAEEKSPPTSKKQKLIYSYSLILPPYALYPVCKPISIDGGFCYNMACLFHFSVCKGWHIHVQSEIRWYWHCSISEIFTVIHRKTVWETQFIFMAFFGHFGRKKQPKKSRCWLIPAFQKCYL